MICRLMTKKLELLRVLLEKRGAFGYPLCPMDWIHNYQLFLFDFDGLLVNTEKLHFAAYVEMCKGRGFVLDWDFNKYCSIAHSDDTALRKAIYWQFPKLFEQEPDWMVLYAEKKRAYFRLLEEGRLELMPGVEKLLKALEKANIKRCVVTHSLREQVDYIKEKLPLLNTIPVWITREDYTRAKPDPDGYLRAIERLGEPGDMIVGFEDSLRGFKALSGTSAKPVLICRDDHPQMREMRGITHFNSLEQVCSIGL
jgi:beta-phosphoglucomutase